VNLEVANCGYRKFQLVEDGHAEIRSTLEFAYESGVLSRAVARQEVDRLLEDQFNSHLSPCAREWAPEVSGCAPFVSVMETADLRDSYDLTEFWRLHSPRFR
jgi:hypothetical protein